MSDDDAADSINRKRNMRYEKFNDWLQSAELESNFGILGGSARSVFNRLDKDNDGYLDFDELIIGLDLLGLDVDENNANIYFSMIDLNNDNLINFPEFEDFVDNYMKKENQCHKFLRFLKF